MPYEDFTTYTEVDPNSHISVSANNVNHLHYRDEDAYVYEDFGAGYFGDFEHLVVVNFTSGQNASYSWTWMLANAVDDVKGLTSASEKFVGLRGNWWDGTLDVLTLWYYDGSNNHTDSYDASPNTPYYLTIERSNTTLTCKIYSDAERSNLLDTLALDVTSDAFRYVFVCNTENTGSSAGGYTDIDNLDLQEAAATAQPYSFIM
jgi:hypothetical protein